MRRAIIVGSRSMLGIELASALAAAGVDVIRCSREVEADVSYDLSNLAPAPVTDTPKVNAMFICAASFAGNEWNDFIKNGLINTLAMYRLAEWAVKLGCEHVLMAGTISSCNEFPQSSYGFSKSQGEEVMRFCCEREGVKFTSLRLPQLCDDMGLCARHQVWFSRIVARAAAGENLYLPEGDMLRNFLHVIDACRTFISAWHLTIPGIHVICSPEYYTYQCMTEIAFQVFGKGGRVIKATDMKPFTPIQWPQAYSEQLTLPNNTCITVREAFERIRDKGTAKNFPA
jgi:nucleoside-diphosphate-sugar epimerase